MTFDITSYLDELRNSLSDYCISTCKAQCCKKGKLLLMKDNEVDLIIKDKKEEFLKNKILEKQETGFYYFDFEKHGACPHLDSNNMCKVYKNPSKPRICSDYPLFKTGDFVIAAGNCQAVQEGILNEKLEKVKEFGFKVV